MSDLDTGKSPIESIVIIGGGMSGLLAAMLLADDGREVLVLERDPAAPPADPVGAWADWDRSSVRQFHMGHFFLPRFRSELAEHLPRVEASLREAGALSLNPLELMPPEFSGGIGEGDERFEALTGRRPVVEAVVASCAAATDGLTIRRGVSVASLVVDPADGGSNGEQPIHVVGVETAEGEVITADLVVDASGRNSGLPKLLAAAGAPDVVDESDDSGFVYYGRTYRSDDGSVPPSIGGGLQSYGSISTLTLAADNGTWQIALVASGKDKTMRKVRDEDLFNEVWGSYPLVAHWLDGEPLSDIAMMANLEDRIRHFVVDDRPVATGLAAVGDSWACTNPSVGRGSSIALLHALALRDQVREESTADPVAWALAWRRRTAETVEPFFRETVEGDRHRLATIEASIAGEDYESDDPFHAFTTGLEVASSQDPEVLRAYLDVFFLHRTVAEVMTDEALVAKVAALSADAEAAPGLTRSELEAVLV